MSVLSSSRADELRKQIRERASKKPSMILRKMLYSGGISSRKFRQLCRKASGWREIQDMANCICSAKAVIVTKGCQAFPASHGVYETGGCSSYLRLQDFLSEGKGWGHMTLPKSSPTVVELVGLALKLKANGRPVKLTRHQRSKFGKEKVQGQDVTAGELFCKLSALAACP